MSIPRSKIVQAAVPGHLRLFPFHEITEPQRVIEPGLPEGRLLRGGQLVQVGDHVSAP